jgi:ubiquinone/menaquinone biosynthesis C-methylase UbiE
LASFVQLYFDRVYNPIYDATTARLSRYRSLQSRCLQALELQDAQRLLCVGLGTGNEAVAALRTAPHLRLAGIDFTPSALTRSRAKLRRAGRRAELRLMDAAALRYPDRCFDRVLCLHVLDFVDEVDAVVREIVRVLRPGGRFALTLPTRPEGSAMGVALARDQVQSALRSGRNPLLLVAELLLKLPLGMLYLPLLLRPRKRSFSSAQARLLFADLPVGDLGIQEEQAYQDLIISGKRS